MLSWSQNYYHTIRVCMHEFIAVVDILLRNNHCKLVFVLPWKLMKLLLQKVNLPWKPLVYTV